MIIITLQLYMSMVHLAACPSDQQTGLQANFMGLINRYAVLSDSMANSMA